MQKNNRKDREEIRKNLRNNSTSAEKLLWQYLRKGNLDGVKFRRQHSYGPYIMDFYAAKYRLCIELDGAGHFTMEGGQRDDLRTAFLNEGNIEVLRIENRDIVMHPEGVLAVIREKIEERKKGLRF